MSDESATVIPLGVPADAAAIEILPSPLVMVTLLPAVSVAAAGPEEPPMIICPLDVSATEPTASVPVSCDISTALSVKDVAPVPPLATASVADRPAALPEYPAEVIVPKPEPASANVIVPPSASSVIFPSTS